MPKVKGKLVKAKGPKVIAIKKPREIALPSKPPLAEYDPAQLRMGIEVEKEHTSDPKLARQIAEDHLREIPDYYTRLIAMENEYKKEVGERDKKKNWTYIILRRRQDEKKPTLRKSMNLSYAEGIVEIQQGKNQAGGYGWQCESVPATTKDGGIKYFCRKMGPDKLRIDYIFELLSITDLDKIRTDIIFEGKHGQTTGEEVVMIDKKVTKKRTGHELKHIDIGTPVDYHGKKAIVTNVFKDGVEIDAGDGNLEIISLNELYGELTKKGKHFGVDKEMIYTAEDINAAWNEVEESVTSLEAVFQEARIFVETKRVLKSIYHRLIIARDLLGKYVPENYGEIGANIKAKLIPSSKTEEIPEAVLDLVEAEIDRVENV